MDGANIPLGLFIPSQKALNAKTFTLSQAELSDLGEDNYLAYAYHKGLVAYCAQEQTRWEWRPVKLVESFILKAGTCSSPSAKYSITEYRIKKAVINLFNIPDNKVNVYPMKK